MIAFILGALIAGLFLGYPLWNARRTIDEQADTARIHLIDLATKESQIEIFHASAKRNREHADYWRNEACDERNARVLAEHDRDGALTAMRGLLTNLARQEELRPDEARGSADVVELRRRAK